jgi:hypothetical protein
MSIHFRAAFTISLLLGTLSVTGCYGAADLHDDDDDNEAAINVSTAALTTCYSPSPSWATGAVCVTPTSDYKFIVEGVYLRQSNGDYFNQFQVCYKKKWNIQSCWDSGASNVQGKSSVMSSNPADGNFTWLTPTLYAGTTYRIKVQAAIYNSVQELHDGYHDTLAGSGSQTPYEPPVCDCEAECGGTGGVCGSQGCACY